MQTYENLAGAEGRRIFYRAERHSARELFAQSPPVVDLDLVPHTLINLSMSGIAVRADRAANWQHGVGDELPLHIRVHDAVLHRGRGRVVRVEPGRAGRKIALQLTTGCLDVAGLRAAHNELGLRLDLERDTAAGCSDVAVGYRQLCADIVHMLRRYRATLARFDAADKPERAAEVLALCEERALVEWRELWRQANLLVRTLSADPEAMKATKRFTELVVTPELAAGPIWARSYEKPLGYPGDFEIMNQVYAWRPIGDGAYGRLCHRLGLEVAECIATRMVLVQGLIRDVVAARRDACAPVQIASLGCGPAQEVVNYLKLRPAPADRRGPSTASGHEAGAAAVHFTLIDQDHAALACAYERSYPQVMRRGGRASVRCYHASFPQLMRAGSLFGKLGPQDMIYSVGLVDYLNGRRARALTESLYEQLAPGGTLVIGNMKETALSNLWPMEYVTDWSVIYRTADEMRAWAAGLGAAGVDVLEEPTGRVLLLKLRKPA